MPELDFSRKPVLVLGASGFIGSRVVAALSARPIYRAIAASRRSIVAVDATNSDAVRAVLRDMDYVVNCVAGGAMVRSTQVLCDAARDCPPRRIVHLSSMAVYGRRLERSGKIMRRSHQSVAMDRRRSSASGSFRDTSMTAAMR